MNHVALLGDSVFDNGGYVDGGPDVAAHLQTLVPKDWQVSLLAVDGARIDDVSRQLRGRPSGVTHLVLSVGGNDALAQSGVFEMPVASVAEALAALATIGQRFAHAYALMLDEVLAIGLPMAVCTIYDTNYPEPRRTLAVTALAIINDAITRAAFRRGIGLVDLRLVCDDPADFANPIEPSVQGGRKIAAAIAAWAASQHDQNVGSQVFV